MRTPSLSLALPLLLPLALGGPLGCRTVPKVDEAGDGLVDETATDADGDGVAGADDCDDSDPAVGPGAEERCNGIDDDCDGEVDEGVLAAFLVDADGDGFGDPDAALVQACAPPEGHVAADLPGDCDDADPAVFPAAPEACDGVDNDCDGEVDNGVMDEFFVDADGDGHGDPAAPVAACAPAAGIVADDGDCDDADPAVHPGAAEVCNERDDDCDGTADNGVTTTFFVDTDGDGWGQTGATTEACAVPEGYAARPGDCDDGAAAVSPDASERCNGIDDDCDGDLDEVANQASCPTKL